MWVGTVDEPGDDEAPEEGAWAPAVAHLRRADRRVARLIDRIGPCGLTPRGARRPFEALVETIIYQQLSGKAAGTIFARVQALVGPRRKLTPERVADLDDAALRGAGVSGPKVRAIRDLTERALDGRLRLGRLASLPEAELEAALTAVHGIGPWSVQMFLIFRLGKSDVWPITDLGIRKGAQKLWALDELPKPKDLEARGERFRPYRSVLAWYLWRSLD